MTDIELIAYYANLLVLQYIGDPKAYATIQTLVTPVIMDQLVLQVQNAFQIGTAVGVQLDILGKYAGVTRNGFGLNGTPITLDDTDFTKLIQLAIAQNTSGSSLYDIQAFLAMFFPGEIFVFDFLGMRMSYYLNTSVGSIALAEVFVTSGLLPKPMGVQLGITVLSPNIDKFFGFRTYRLPPVNNSPFNTYHSYSLDSPWLSYQDGLIF